MTKKKTLRHRGVVASDSISEMIAQIQNGLLVGRNSIAITRNSTTMQVANILLREGYIEAIINSSNNSNFIAIILKYKSDGNPVITGLQRISRPGLRVYVNSKELPRVLDGMGLVLLSTSQGVIDNYQAQSSKIGGEVLGCVW